MNKDKIVTGIVAGIMVPIAIGLGVKQFLNSPEAKSAISKAKKSAHKKAKEVYKRAGATFNLK